MGFARQRGPAAAREGRGERRPEAGGKGSPPPPPVATWERRGKGREECSARVAATFQRQVALQGSVVHQQVAEISNKNNADL